MKKKILIIEDDPFLGDVLTQKLAHEGYEVTLVRDGAEGFQRISSTQPDLILLDLNLPTFNGYEILEARQRDPRSASIPVIVISNSGEPVEINRVLALGVKDYLIKAQFEPEEVLAKVRAQLSEKTNDSVSNETRKKLKGRKILWIEDDTFLSELLSTKLVAEGTVALHARDGEEALHILEKETPDVILLDLVLPGISGFDILKHIKKDERLKKIPVIVLSNLGQQDDIDRTKALGAAKHLVKSDLDLDRIAYEISSVIPS